MSFYVFIGIAEFSLSSPSGNSCSERGREKKKIFGFKQEGRLATKTSCRMQDTDTHDFCILCILYYSETGGCCKKDKRTYREAKSPQPLLPFHELTAVWRLQLETLTAVIWFLPLYYCFPPKISVEIILNGSEAMQYFCIQPVHSQDKLDMVAVRRNCFSDVSFCY